MKNYDAVKLSGFLQKIESRQPSFVKELKDYELEEMLLFLDDQRGKEQGFCNDLLCANPGMKLEETGIHEKMSRYDQLQKFFRQEIARRNPPPETKEEKPGMLPVKLSGKKGVKTGLIRIFSALYGLDYFRDEGGMKLSKLEVMSRIGALFGEDWRNYDKDLSQAFLQSKEANTGVFDELKQEILKQYEESEARRR
ncbi:MAG: hypothetical protein R3D58_09815 [Saprospiraceae bacterium]